MSHAVDSRCWSPRCLSVGPGKRKCRRQAAEHGSSAEVPSAQELLVLITTDRAWGPLRCVCHLFNQWMLVMRCVGQMTYPFLLGAKCLAYRDMSNHEQQELTSEQLCLCIKTHTPGHAWDALRSNLAVALFDSLKSSLACMVSCSLHKWGSSLLKSQTLMYNGLCLPLLWYRMALLPPNNPMCSVHPLSDPMASTGPLTVSMGFPFPAFQTFPSCGNRHLSFLCVGSWLV